LRRIKDVKGDPWRMQGVFFFRTEDMGEVEGTIPGNAPVANRARFHTRPFEIE